MSLSDFPAPATPGTGGQLIKTLKDSVTGELYQVIIPANPDGSVGGVSTIYSGSVTSTTTKQPLASQVLLAFLTLEASSTNSNSLWIGNSGVAVGTGYELVPGASVSLPVANANEVYVVGAGQLNYIAG